MLPKCEAAVERGYEVLYLTDDVDEFALKMLGKYGEFEFKNVTDEALDIASDEEKSKIEEANSGSKDMLDFMKDAIGGVSAVKFSPSLTKHAACLSTEGELSVEMEKVLKRMPGAEGAPEARVVLELNHSHPVTEKLFKLFAEDKEKLSDYAKLLYSEACLISGVAIEDPRELAELINKLL
jgi:molecular chaperone HtpG